MLKVLGQFILFLSGCCFVGALFSGVSGYMSTTGNLYLSTTAMALSLGKVLLVLGIVVLLINKYGRK